MTSCGRTATSMSDSSGPRRIVHPGRARMMVDGSGYASEGKIYSRASGTRTMMLEPLGLIVCHNSEAESFARPGRSVK